VSKYRITVELEDAEYRGFMSFLQGFKIDVVKDKPEPTGVASRDRVKYMAIANREALEGLGERTIIGIIFSHLCDKGEDGTTASEIRSTKLFNAHTIQASLQKLKIMGLVASRAIEDGQA
jgi:hypothetical protein